jgi:RNA polymerase sigma-70 factor, ECF subfamily
MTETTSFEAMVAAYQDMVYTTAVRILGNEAEAEDISQEVFLKAYEHFAELDQNPSAGGWLRTVTRNLSLNHLSRYRFRWRFFSELDHEEEGYDYAANLPATEHGLPAGEQADRQQIVETALQKLPDSQRVPLALYHFEEMSYEAIAAQLGVSLAKVKTDIHRGRDALARRLRSQMAAETGWAQSPGTQSSATLKPPPRPISMLC